jgi:hypothetical protein
MDTKDQEKIYQLYENFRDIESTQPSTNLARVQDPNYSPHLSVGAFLGIMSPSNHDRLTPEQEEGESKFKYRDDQGNVFSLIKVDEDGVAHLRDKRVGAIIKIPISKLSRVLKEI